MLFSGCYPDAFNLNNAISNLRRNCVTRKKVTSFLMAKSRVGCVQRRLCIPNEPVRVISAKLSAPVSALQTFWPSSPKRFIWSGFELLPTKTFESYAMHDGDSVIALPQGHYQLELIQEWIHVTRDLESFNDTVRSMVNPATTREVARLHDLRWASLNRRPRAFHKLCLAMASREEVIPVVTPTVIPSSTASSPSTAALPSCWT